MRKDVLDYSHTYCGVCRLYVPLMVLLCFVAPTVVPVHYWSEGAWTAFFTCGVLRYVAVLNVTWTVNSVAHLWGNRPYDRRINPRENVGVAFSACGEGYHNYHHVFPSDYSTSEHGWMLNPTTFFIDLMSFFGLASHRKTMSVEVVRRRMERTGDGTTGFGWQWTAAGLLDLVACWNSLCFGYDIWIYSMSFFLLHYEMWKALSAWRLQVAAAVRTHTCMHTLPLYSGHIFSICLLLTCHFRWSLWSRQSDWVMDFKMSF